MGDSENIIQVENHIASNNLAVFFNKIFALKNSIKNQLEKNEICHKDFLQEIYNQLHFLIKDER